MLGCQLVRMNFRLVEGKNIRALALADKQIKCVYTHNWKCFTIALRDFDDKDLQYVCSIIFLCEARVRRVCRVRAL